MGYFDRNFSTRTSSVISAIVDVKEKSLKYNVPYFKK